MPAAALVLPAGRNSTRPLVDRARFGAWAATSGQVVPDHVALEELVRAPLPVFSWFQPLADPWDGETTRQIAALDTGDTYDCMVCWEAWGVRLSDVAAGGWDQQIAAYMTAAGAYPGQVLIRLFHEPNGTWYPWALANENRLVNSADEWRAAWRRVVRVAREQHADNVQFVFCPNTDDVGGIAAEEYWPGHEWVDVIGVDGYNWGWSDDGVPEKTAEEIIAPMYQRLTALHPTAEFMVGEIGCVPHAQKGAWFRALYQTPRFSRLTRVAFFHEDKEEDWRLDSDRSSLEVHRTYLRRADAADIV